MNTEPSLYDSSRFAVVGAGLHRVRVCICEVDGSASSRAPSSRRVLLIHGNPSHLNHWIHTVPALNGHAVLAYDQPGLGKSDDFADATQSLERSVDIALAVLDEVGWTEPVDIVGQSHGGLVAIALAACAPNRVRSIVLLGTGGTPAHSMYRLFRLPGLDRALLMLGRAMSPKAPTREHGGRTSLLDEWLEKFVAAAIHNGARGSFAPDPVPPSIIAEGLRAPPTILRTMVRLAHDRPCDKVAPYARRVRAPVLFIHGREDRLVHVSYAKRLFEIMHLAGTEARFVELEGGHMLHFSRPLAVNPLLKKWFAS